MSCRCKTPPVVKIGTPTFSNSCKKMQQYPKPCSTKVSSLLSVFSAPSCLIHFSQKLLCISPLHFPHLHQRNPKSLYHIFMYLFHAILHLLPKTFFSFPERRKADIRTYISPIQSKDAEKMFHGCIHHFWELQRVSPLHVPILYPKNTKRPPIPGYIVAPRIWRSALKDLFKLH